jgi:hypothetical protein
MTHDVDPLATPTKHADKTRQQNTPTKHANKTRQQKASKKVLRIVV